MKKIRHPELVEGPTPINPTGALIISAILIALASFGVIACGTVTPDFTAAQNIRFGSDGFQDAGVKGVVVDRATGVRYLTYTEEDRVIFDGLVSKYGAASNPPVTKDEGWILFSPGLYAVRNDIQVDFVQWWKQAGLKGVPQ